MEIAAKNKSRISRTELIRGEEIKKDFPILERTINGRPLIYLDNAATTQKPRSVINALTDYYEHHNANVHRGLHTLAEEATAAFEKTRDRVAAFINAGSREQIIYTRNATESINLVAYSWGKNNIREGDRVVATQMEHHANLVPWIQLAREKRAEIEYIPIDQNGYLDLENLDRIITANTGIVAVTHMSNVLGTINSLEKIISRAREVGAVVLVDGAQAVPHMPVDVQALDCDFYVFSAHKMLGPTGLGFLYGKRELLEKMDPFIMGGEMILEVRYDYAGWNDLPYKFEAGTPNIAAAAAFLPALEYLENLGMENVRGHERHLTDYALKRMSQLKHLKIYGPPDAAQRGGTIAFSDADIHPHDLATFLDTRGIAVRAGHHCAQPLTRLLGVTSTTRASFYIYNTTEDIDALIDGLTEARRYFGYAG